MFELEPEMVGVDPQISEPEVAQEQGVGATDIGVLDREHVGRVPPFRLAEHHRRRVSRVSPVANGVGHGTKRLDPQSANEDQDVEVGDPGPIIAAGR